jgi:dipeptidyl aminopeptidase/acylaminoacyl peptidase
MPDPSTRVSAGWELRYRVPRVTLPAWAKQRPDRCAFVTDLPGRPEVYCWDRVAPALRQVTARPAGTRHCAISASGLWVWWFDDTDGDECGVWMRQPFEGGPDEPVAPSLSPAWSAGVVIGMADHALIGQSTEDGTSIFLIRPDGAESIVYRHDEGAVAVDLSRDLELVAIDHSEDGDTAGTRVKVLRPDGTAVADIGEEDVEFGAVGFAPVRGDSRLLIMRRRDDEWAPLVYDVSNREQRDIDLGLAGDIDVQWFQDGATLLVVSAFEGRSELHRYELATGALTRLDVPAGTVHHARTRPSGGVWYLWSSAAQPPQFRAIGDTIDVALPAPAVPPTAPVRDLWVDGPGGRVHALVSQAATDSVRPCPAVFLLHGGPDEHDSDAFDPEVAAWTDHGFVVVRVNYRGSSGYGKAWEEAVQNRIGHTELEDVAAIRDHLVGAGVIDGKRLVLAGWSWGGYLTLLGLGLQPDAWAVGLAGSPVADCAAAYAEEMDGARALDRALFGGSPDEVPDRYRDASPITYVESVRSPVFVVAGVNDPRCPIGQVESYVARLAELRVPHQLHRHGTGHDMAAVDERIELFRRRLAFVSAHLAL